MSQATPDNMVVEFIENNLSPTENERKQIGRRYEDLSTMLKGVNFQCGSYARFTAITPVNDLDVIWEVDPEALKKIPDLARLQKSIDPVELDVSNLLHDLAERLKKEYKNIGQTPRIKPQTHSVGIFFGETDDDFSVDIVPAVPSGDKNEYGDDIYLVPEIIKLSKTHRTKRYQESENAINWLRSDPKGYIQDAKELNEANEYFRKTAKFAKSWKYSCKKKDDIFPLKSFHLELIVTDLYKKNLSLGCLDGICSFFDLIDNYLDSPHFSDKADASKFVDDYINEFNKNEWSAVKNSIIHAKAIIAQIKNATDHDEIERLLVGLVNVKPEVSIIDDRHTRVVPAYSKPYFGQWYEN